MRIFLPLLLALGVFVFALTSCSSSEKGAEDMKPKVEESQPAPAPGTAEVSAEVLSVNESESGTMCKIKITKVHGYGNTTPRLSMDTEFEVMLSKYLVSKGTKVESGNTYEMTLQSSMDQEESKASWVIASVK